MKGKQKLYTLLALLSLLQAGVTQPVTSVFADEEMETEWVEDDYVNSVEDDEDSTDDVKVVEEEESDYAPTISIENFNQTEKNISFSWSLQVKTGTNDMVDVEILDDTGAVVKTANGGRYSRLDKNSDSTVRSSSPVNVDISSLEPGTYTVELTTFPSSANEEYVGRTTFTIEEPKKEPEEPVKDDNKDSKDTSSTSTETDTDNKGTDSDDSTKDDSSADGKKDDVEDSSKDTSADDSSKDSTDDSTEDSSKDKEDDSTKETSKSDDKSKDNGETTESTDDSGKETVESNKDYAVLATTRLSEANASKVLLGVSMKRAADDKSGANLTASVVDASGKVVSQVSDLKSKDIHRNEFNEEGIAFVTRNFNVSGLAAGTYKVIVEVTFDTTKEIVKAETNEFVVTKEGLAKGAGTEIPESDGSVLVSIEKDPSSNSNLFIAWEAVLEQSSGGYAITSVKDVKSGSIIRERINISNFYMNQVKADNGTAKSNKNFIYNAGSLEPGKYSIVVRLSPDGQDPLAGESIQFTVDEDKNVTIGDKTSPGEGGPSSTDDSSKKKTSTAEVTTSSTKKTKKVRKSKSTSKYKTQRLSVADFQSVAGTWRNSNGDVAVIDANGNVIYNGSPTFTYHDEQTNRDITSNYRVDFSSVDDYGVLQGMFIMHRRANNMAMYSPAGTELITPFSKASLGVENQERLVLQNVGGAHDIQDTEIYYRSADATPDQRRMSVGNRVRHSLPSTGDIVKWGASIAGLAVIVVAGTIFVRRNKNQ